MASQMKATGLALLVVAGGLAACGHTEWFRIAPGPGNFSQDQYACQRESLQVAPVAVVTDVTVQRDKDGRRRENVTHQDVNSYNRESLFNGCMNARGWQARFVSDDAPRPTPVVAAQPAPPPPRQAQPGGRVVFAPEVLAPPKNMSEKGLEEFNRYTATNRLHKAFAVGQNRSFAWRSGLATPDEAAAAAMQACAQYGPNCTLYAVDDSPAS